MAKDVRKLTEEEYNKLLEEYGGGATSGDESKTDLGEAVDFGVEGIKKTASTLKDTAISALQSASLDWLDDGIELISPNKANEWRELVAKAREESPVATTLGDILTPDILFFLGGLSKTGKLEKLGKFLNNSKSVGSAVAKSVGTDLVSQLGESDSISDGVDLTRLGVSAGLGGGMKAVGNVLPTAKLIEKTHLDIDRDAMAKRAGGALHVDDLVDSTLEALRGSGFYSKGPVKFNPDTLGWHPLKVDLKGNRTISDIPKNPPLFSSPSRNELLTRLEDAKETISAKLDDIVDSASNIWGEAVISAEEIAKIKGNITRSIKNFDNPKSQKKAIHQMIESRIDSAIKEDGTTSLRALHEVRKSLDLELKKVYEKGVAPIEPVMKEAKLGLASELRKLVNNRIESIQSPNMDGRQFKILNEAYGEVSNLAGPLEEAVLNGGTLKLSTSLGSRNLAVQGLGVLSNFGITGPMAAGARTIEKAMDTVGSERVLRKAPSIFNRELQPTENVNPPQFNPMKPMDRINLNLPSMLLNKKLPRTTKGLIQNKDLFKLKIAQDAENTIRARAAKSGIHPDNLDPEYIRSEATNLYKNMSDIIDGDENDVKSAMPLIVDQFPHLFDKDKYGRIDYTVPSSRLAEVRNDIRKSSRTNTEKIQKIHQLNLTNEYMDDDDKEWE